MAFIQTFLPYVQITISVILVVIILLQQKGVGLGAAFGGEGGVYNTKRGFEKILFVSTIVLGIIFVLLAILGLF